MQHVMALTFERLRAGEVCEPERMLSFVLGTSRMTVLDQRRGERWREALLQRYADADPVVEPQTAPRLDQQRVADCLDRLPERERAVLVMSFYDEQPCEAVAVELGLSIHVPPPAMARALGLTTRVSACRLRSANAVAVAFGVFMYFPTLVEVPVARMFPDRRDPHPRGIPATQPDPLRLAERSVGRG